jgi:hypothetical protein
MRPDDGDDSLQPAARALSATSTSTDTAGLLRGRPALKRAIGWRSAAQTPCLIWHGIQWAERLKKLDADPVNRSVLSSETVKVVAHSTIPVLVYR